MKSWRAIKRPPRRSRRNFKSGDAELFKKLSVFYLLGLSMTKQSNNHFVSRFYLKYWANSDNKVWVLHKTDETENRQAKNSEQVHIKFICSEEKLYWIGEDTIIEKWSDKNIETICGSVFKKVIENEEITDKDIDYIKAFLALNISRHPSLKQVSKQLMDVFDT